jgi:hypothetical protein
VSQKWVKRLGFTLKDDKPWMGPGGINYLKFVRETPGGIREG